MCRSIKSLFNYNPPATEEEIREASLQFVRKISGFQKPSAANEKAFNASVEKISTDIQNLLDSLTTVSKPRNRVEEAVRARARNEKRFGKLNKY